MHKMSKESANTLAGLQIRLDEAEKILAMTSKKADIIKNEYELNEESEVGMYFSIMLSLLVMKTEYSTSYIKLNEIQAIEMVDKSDGGIITITLKGDKTEQIVYAEDKSDKWIKAKEWMDSNVINLSGEISKKDLHRHRDTNPGF